MSMLNMTELLSMIVTLMAGTLAAILNRASKRHVTVSEKTIEILRNIKENGSNSQGSDGGNGTEKKFDEKIEELIQDHHKQAIMQSTVQFWFSLFASVVGFIFIITIIVVSKDLQWYEYIAKIFPGIVIEAVSVLFFSQSKETRERASDFLNKLREDRQFTKSIGIVDTITDEKLKSLIKAEIALRLCGVQDIDVITNEIKNKE